MSRPATELHRQLVDHLVARRWIRTPAIEAAFRAVPRHLFVPDQPLEAVYRDVHLTAKEDRGWRLVTSTGPWLMATMLEQLRPLVGQRILEIGAGMGYNAALLAHLVGPTGSVTSLDIDPDAIAWAGRGLTAAKRAGVDGAAVDLRCADGFAGASDGAPWDAILVTVRTDQIPPAWVEQLAPVGRLVVPLALGGVRHGQLSIAFESRGDHLRSLSVRDCGFVRPRGAMALSDRELQLGDRPGLLWGDAGSHDLPAEKILALLSAAGPLRETGLVCRRRELTEDFQPWLIARDGETCSLRAEREWAAWPAIVPLVEAPGRFRGTGGLFDGEGMALLGLVEPSEAQPDGRLVVRQHGDGDSSTRLVEHLREWDRAGRPGRERLTLRLHGRGGGPPPVCVSGVRRVEAWGDLIVEWPGDA